MNIIYEDNHLIAVNKAVGEIVQGDKTYDICLLDMVKDYIKQTYNKPGNVFLGLPHRLDRPTSGVVLFARTSKALTRLNDMFRSHEQIKKIYWAIVPKTNNKLLSKEPVRLENWLLRREKENKSYIVGRDTKDAKKAILTYRLLAEGERYALLEIELETGRHHQIRCQLAAIGLPIKGDLKYGAKRSNKNGGIDLHARSISFLHPVTKQQITITAPVPQDNLWQELTSSI